jgi:23S rRNA (adenine2503-C2)-methyltransferase
VGKVGGKCTESAARSPLLPDTISHVTSLHDPAGLLLLAARHRVQPQHLHRLATLVNKRGFEWEAALAELPVPLPGALVGELRRVELDLERRIDSEEDGATRLLFRTAKGLAVESVLLRIASGRTSLCLSCQSGCPVRCSFCATGREGLRGDLTVEEILDQLVQGQQLAAAEQRLVRNLVFMGMGEPLFVEDTLHEVLRRLVHPRAFAFPPTRIAVSTVGIPEGMVRLSEAFPEVRIAVSLHHAKQSEREALIPLARIHPLDELRRAIAEVGRPESLVMIEYLLLEGRTDRPEDLEALAAWLEGLPVRINWIPYNRLGTDDPLRPTPPAERERIAALFRARGFLCTMRRSLGSGVLAGCGQLAGEVSCVPEGGRSNRRSPEAPTRAPAREKRES